MQIPLTLDSLGALDSGAARVIIDAAIRQAVSDLDDRGEDGKPRQAIIHITFNRLDNGLIAAHVEAEAKIPKRRTASTLGVVRQKEGRAAMIFSELSPDDPHQRTVDEFEQGGNADAR